jgi:hypothetical protein
MLGLIEIWWWSDDDAERFEREREREREFVSWLLTLFFAGKGHSEEFSGYGNAW